MAARISRSRRLEGSSMRPWRYVEFHLSQISTSLAGRSMVSILLISPKLDFAGLSGRSRGFGLDESGETIDRATHSGGGADKNSGGRIVAIVAFLNIVAIDFSDEMEGSVSDVEAQLERAFVGAARLQRKRGVAKTFGGGMEDDVVLFVRKPDDHGQFVDFLARGNFHIDPSCGAGFEGSLFASAIADANLGDVRDLRFQCGGRLGAKFEVFASDTVGFAESQDFAVIEEHGTLANLGDGLEIVGNEKHRGATLDNGADAIHALLLEDEVADAENFVNDEHFRIDVSRNRETQTGVHAGRIALHRRFDELFDAGEGDDLFELGLNFALGHTKNSAVEKNVLHAGKVGMEAGSNFDEGR